ncbi:MAG TPA: aminotransferase class III-fold pyridoxal phosphate-dependent enzyme, partial [Chloroflexota bacterium]|nr:aminotransferase class III-fold pyridoxal phosphate-dependent enzyme [Chloroflexota bacterium]
PTSSGVPEEALATMKVLPTDLAAVEAALANQDVAAVILEPTGGSWGTLPVDEAFCRALRTLTEQTGTLLIFDEVITGFRCSPGGAQAAYGITPDLTTMAKIVAGGLPGGAVAGRADVLGVLEFDGNRPGWNRGGRISHPGTFNGNPLSAAAGVACLEIVAQGDVHRHVNALAERLRRGFNAAGRPYGLDGCTYGTFSMFHISLDRALLPTDPRAARRYSKSKGNAEAKLRRALLVQGIDLMGAGGMLSLAHTEQDVDRTIEAFGHALAALAHEGAIYELAVAVRAELVEALRANNAVRSRMTRDPFFRRVVLAATLTAAGLGLAPLVSDLGVKPADGLGTLVWLAASLFGVLYLVITALAIVRALLGSAPPPAASPQAQRKTESGAPGAEANQL